MVFVVAGNSPFPAVRSIGNESRNRRVVLRERTKVASYSAVRIGQQGHITLEPSIACPACNGVEPLNNQRYLDFTFGTPTACNRCGVLTGLSEALFPLINDAPWHPCTLGISGAISVSFSFIMDPGEIAHVDLEQLGIPEDSQILRTTYSTGNGFHPIELPSWTDQRIRRYPPRQYDLYAHPDDEYSSETEDFLTTVTFLTPDQQAAPLGVLADPLTRLAENDRAMVPILLCAAVEDLLTEVVDAHFTPSGGQRATVYAKRLTAADGFDVLLPSIAESNRIPRLDDATSELYRSLRATRNKHAHSARRRVDVATEELLSAILALVHVHFVRQVQLGTLTFEPPAESLATADYRPSKN
jgi:hypothetical protein